MNKKLIRDLAITGGIYDCITDPYDKLNNGDAYSSVMVDLERFAEKIVKECTDILMLEHAKAKGQHNYYHVTANKLKKHFGVEE